MKQAIVGMFASKARAEEMIRHVNTALNIPHDDISYVYRSSDSDTVTRVVDADAVPARDSAADGAVTGAVVGGSIGALAGLATVAGIIPVIGPIFAAGPILTALGVSAGAVGTMAAGGLTGVIAGGLVGTLVNLGATESQAQVYEKAITAGEILVVVHSDRVEEVKQAFAAHGATSIAVLAQPVA